MTVLLLTLPGVSSELLLADERLVCVRQLMSMGSYGELKSIVPAERVPALCALVTSCDPGALGLYGPRVRGDRSYASREVDFSALSQPAIWHAFAERGAPVVVGGGPGPVGPQGSVIAHPPALLAELNPLLAGLSAQALPCDLGDGAKFRDAVFEHTARQYSAIESLLERTPPAYLQFVDRGIEWLFEGSAGRTDSPDRGDEAGTRREGTVGEYLLECDQRLGRWLERLSDDALVLIVSPYGARPLLGSFAVNEWLRREGYLALEEEPQNPTGLSAARIDWQRTKAWAEGEQAIAIYFNLVEREPAGTVSTNDYSALRQELEEKLTSLAPPGRPPLGARVLDPDGLYACASGMAPDLIVDFPAAAWTVNSDVGQTNVWMEGNRGLPGFRATPRGAFVLAAGNSPLSGEVSDASLLDLAPTVLELAGLPIPPSMQGRSLVAGRASAASAGDQAASDEEIVRQRLKGLGYIE